MVKPAKSFPTFHNQHYEIISEEKPYQGFGSVSIYKVKHQLFRGGESELMQREVYHRHPAVGVLLFDPNLLKVVMVEQFRIGAIADEHSPWLLELVAGIIDVDETPEQVAVREVAEEAGLIITENDLQLMTHYFVSPGSNDEQFTLFCARVDASQAGGVFGLEHEHEDIKVHVLSLDELFEALAQGRIKNAPAIIAVQWLQMQQLLGINKA